MYRQKNTGVAGIFLHVTKQLINFQGATRLSADLPRRVFTHKKGQR